ncbi:MAG: DUF4198 domain-containing protein [Desulfovibrio sp.]|jgi:hypothetical protein|nr:DUF4198 domain-containing protein [Desulfovibrio sp.]
MPVACFVMPHRSERHRVAALVLSGVICCLLPAATAWAQVTLLVPSRTNVEAPAVTGEDAQKTAGKNAQPKARPTQASSAEESKTLKTTQRPDEIPPTQVPHSDDASSEANIAEEADVLITMIHPFNREAMVMDMPRLFAVLRYDNAVSVKDGVLQPERRDLLGDMEEIRYLNQKAWGANVAFDKPGLYQFIIEARPWWDATRDRFLQHFAKTMLPVHGVERGWNSPVGQRFEIQPLTRPFGLASPALFAGRVLLNGTPLPNTTIRLARINTDKSTAPTPWHEELAVVADAAGQFASVLNQPGWWCCMALTEGEPLRGPDGRPRPLELGALLWFYVDGQVTESRKH